MQTTPGPDHGSQTDDVATTGAAPSNHAAAGDDGVDLWQLVALPGGLSVASYLTSPHAVQYRLIVDVLLDAQQHSLQGLPHDELAHLIRERLAGHLVARSDTDDTEPPGPSATVNELLAADFNLEARMRQLDAWDVVDAFEDRIRSDEDFHRHLGRYQLTSLAAELHRAVRRLGDDNASSTAASLAPPVLAGQLDIMARSIGHAPAAVAEAWAVIQPALTGMAESASGWQSQLAGALSGAPDPDKLTTLQETLSRYVDVWGSGVDTHSETIAERARALLDEPADRWRPVALHTAGADADQTRLEQVTAEYRTTLSTLIAWFDGPTSQARGLRRQMRDAIAPLVRGRRTLAAVGGHVSRRAELLSLAEQLEASATDTDAWDLWCRATGLFAARHLNLTSPPPAGNPAAVSFWDAPPATVETRLRRQGPRALVGRPAAMPDRSAGKAAAAAAAAAARAQNAATRAAILRRSGQRLDQWTGLTETEADLLVMFLTYVATAAPDRTGVRNAVTGDGLWELTADPAPAQTPTAAVSTPAGLLVFDNVALRVTYTGSTR